MSRRRSQSQVDRNQKPTAGGESSPSRDRHPQYLRHAQGDVFMVVENAIILEQDPGGVAILRRPLTWQRTSTAHGSGTLLFFRARSGLTHTVASSTNTTHGDGTRPEFRTRSGSTNMA